ncbi:chromosome segregation protein SMC [Marinobacter persicus]|uniref:Chromosome partition protein Smc n=1 Tax=Marinobacter persicus TaxID=930118 RepID=A0A2S6G7F4_9GAMM|nr:chromosome segregation protein SMC [Marinobacter persicus]PPK52202.1 condensin subunit Smc [Marinobacter persicus]PPK55109.1 condensin subunit Smc [Marinobacter persicus]PPK58962.1 condensin subunit Smc [Marinobacter persicus]
MRLKSIKLAGFKSFVDPTTVPFPSNMTAVVGPNGCGKSNIIDAVRWVMGESSAKYLRGESMSDVIFNGSTARKPVGQASIELVFDNSDGSAPGEFTNFNEISVKRRVSREGQSAYFMNGAKCRRRDITDLFLGTGLGPRSYAIIEQGMISRLIEAKPEELRVYIEEAAGISKYKERRRETENRIRRTQENLERLTDLREELERQLQHLEKQAAAAEKYKTLKHEERQKKAELTVLRWQALDSNLHSWREKIRNTELELEKQLTERLSLETSLESLRDDHQQRSEHFSRAQARYYEAGADIARIEQSIEHQRERSRQTAAELDQAMANQRELARELEQDQEKLAGIEEELAMLGPEQEALTLQSEASGEQLQQAEEAMSDWQQRWEDFSNRSSDARRQTELAQSRIRSLEQTVEQLKARNQKLRDEREHLDDQVDREELDLLQEQQETLEAQREEIGERIDELGQDAYSAREALREVEQQASEQRQKVQSLRATLESQAGLLEEQLGQQDDTLQRWLSERGLGDAPRVASALAIEDGWEFAVEQVLGRFTQGIVTPDATRLAEAFSDVPKGLATVFGDSVGHPLTGVNSERLAAKVSGLPAVEHLLADIHVSETAAEAMAMYDSLEPGASIIARDGTWISRHWVLMPDTDAAQIGVIERQKKVTELEAALAEAEAALEQSEQRLEQQREREEQAVVARDQAQNEQRQVERDLGNLASHVSGLKARSEQIEARLRDIGEELESVVGELEEHQENLEITREEWDIALAASEDNEEERERLLEQRDQLRESLDRLRQDARHDRDHAHQLQLQLQTLHSQRDGLKQTIDRMQLQKERLDERLDVLREARESAEEPVEDLQMQLEELLDRRLAEEEKLSAARDALEDIDREVREREQRRHRTDQEAQNIREKLETLKMESQALEIRSGNQLEQLGELDVKLQEVLDRLPEDAEESAWQAELEKIGNRIQRLGAINLAAIEEFQVQSERKRYLDEQNDDLLEALETLDNAIRRIDRETRQRFKETFDKVNSGLQALFPKVFGGGSASLELTGEDLLETGVAIMARPPGKKNTTIHLLSGGEKALTAIALVFSIFQLNPAPFCMLDEVDAPLDDANVGRYANMVKEMSKQVQFIYITHNKIAMENADQLMGVTMHEPGCSRLVSVDVEEAAALAEA